MNGGYLMVSKTDTNLYEKLNKALTIGKPVLWYEDENTCYYIDTITKSGTDIVLTKGGKTITIESDGDITEIGDIQNHLYKHEVYMLDEPSNVSITCIILSNNAELFTLDTFKAYCVGKNVCDISGVFKADDNTLVFICRLYYSGTDVYVYGSDKDGLYVNAKSATNIWNAITAPTTFADYRTQLF